MKILSHLKALSGKSRKGINFISAIKNTDIIVVNVPYNDFYSLLFMESIINIENFYNGMGKKTIVLMCKRLSIFRPYFDGYVKYYQEDNKNKMQDFYNYIGNIDRNSIYVDFTPMPDSIDDSILKKIKSNVKISIGAERSGFNIYIKYQSDIMETIHTLESILCVKHKNVKGIINKKKKQGKGVCIESNIYSIYTGEKIKTPCIMPDFYSLDNKNQIIEKINDCEYVICYKNAYAAIGNLLNKKVICISEDRYLPYGIYKCKNESVEIDYYIE